MIIQLIQSLHYIGNPSLYYLVIIAAAFTACNSPIETTSEITSDQTGVAKVAVLGIFHFGGSTGDLTSIQMDDPFGKRRQDDIKELVLQLSEYKPTKILVEYPLTKAEKLQERYLKFLNGDDTLSVNEIEQVGFRLAKQLGHTQLFPIDYPLNLPGNDLFEYCQRNDKMNEFEEFIVGIKQYVSKQNEKLDTMRISTFLRSTNTDSIDQRTNRAYIENTLSWGDTINEAGAHFAATWWERNFVILKNMVNTIESKEDRLLIIIGSGHRAVLKDLIIDRSDMQYIEIGEYLK